MECGSGNRLRRTVSSSSDLGFMDMNVSPPREVEGDDAGFWVNSELVLTSSAPKMQDTCCNNLFTEFTLTSCNNTHTHHLEHVTNGFPSTNIETNDNSGSSSLVSLQNGSQSHAIKTVDPTSRSPNLKNGESAVKVDSMKNSCPFPVQFEGLFLISVGKVNQRPPYHNTHQIWPIGYKSIWHDKITGSIFVCHVLESDDDYGPIFRVNRHPCSKQSLPNASTVIYNPKCVPSSCLSLTTDSENTPSDINDNFINGDVIGEFMVEGRSTSSAWNMVLETLISACRHAFKDLNVVSFHCNHNNSQQFYGSYGVDSLDKFGCLTLTGQPVDRIPDLILSTEELEDSCMVIRRWLELDRFGLDAEFVQELIEQQLSRVGDCSEYECLDARCHDSIARTVGSGFFTVLHKYNPSDSFTERCKRLSPPGSTIVSDLPPYVIGDVLQAYEFFLRFHEVLGQDAPLSRQILEKELLDPWVNGFNPPNTGSMKPCEITSSSRIAPGTASMMLPNFHMSMLKVLVEDMLAKVTIYDPPFGAIESKSRKGRKKFNMDINHMTVSCKKGNSGIFPLNEITWPEVARRYILVLLSMDDNYEAPDLTKREFDQVFSCLNGDGGPLCGSLTGMAAIEADAMILAGASKRIFSCVKRSKVWDLMIDNKDVDMNECVRERKVIMDNKCPEWIKVLEPIRRQPTNVGARIRNRVFKSLEKGPPEWAKEMLLRSISKDVYKGNASGPTKKIVVSVLDKVRDETPLTKKKVKESRGVSTVSDVITKRCRMVLRSVAAEDINNKAFFGFMKPNEFDDVVTVSRRLDFRTIDLRLDAGFYDNSHESFIEDVREVWENLRIIYRNKPNYIDSIETISRKLEELYKQEVLAFVSKTMEYGNNPEETKKELNMMMIDTITTALFIAPWEDGICKVCGKDENDHILLLCDRCDAEYHTYCLDPPLQRVPKASWYCPPCISFITSQSQSQTMSREYGYGPTKKKSQREFTRIGLEGLADLADCMESMEYWELGVKERVFLLQFLCDESLSSTIIQNHMSEDGFNFQKNFMGRDYDGRLYWALGRPERLFMSGPHTIGETSKSRSSSSSSWVCYESDGEIEALIEWLEDDDLKEKELKENIKNWKRNKSTDFYDHSGGDINRLTSSVHGTNARAELEKKFGEIFRCDCLEIAGPTPNRHHCCSCHSTFSSNEGGHQCVVEGIIGKDIDGGIFGNNSLSFAPVVGKAFEILQLLKIILLDIEAAIPDEGFRPSRKDHNRLRVWRAFLKSAKSIYDMVEASIILEDMIKTEYLRKEWRYWSSPSAAAKIPTISALALQIYALDAAIFYDKPPPVDPPEPATPLGNWNQESNEETPTKSDFKNNMNSTMESVIPGSWNFESKEEAPKKSKMKEKRKSNISTMELGIPGNSDSESKEETPKKSKVKEKRKPSSSRMELAMPGNWDFESKEEIPKKSKIKEKRKSTSSTMELVNPGNWDSEPKEETPKKSKLKEKRKSSSSRLELAMPGNWDSESKEETPKKSKLKENRNSSSSTMEFVIPGNWDSESKEETPKNSKLKEDRKSISSTMELVIPGDSESKEETPKKSKFLDSWKSSSSSTMVGMLNDSEPLKNFIPKSKSRKELDVFNFSD